MLVADGADIIDWAVGDAVINLYMRDFFVWPPLADLGMGLRAGAENGLLTEYTVLPAKRLVRAPKSLSMSEAATIPCAAHTAWTALTKLSQARPGDTVLSLGTGGVALFALALCQKLGIKGNRYDKSGR
ncbi:hypothetical protein [Rhizobium sp. PL01]|uniref:hypothetical protein n=1 Tax=Rhizobium sp. PL01 TaxID=3085631 RepID=UPI0029815CE8|nr:hypothetical protein [Rhizobium sp. PL01]MDW5317186.1 hypothetical protein [Rhizobium sp. PL01]